jgi:hypothetical protein
MGIDGTIMGSILELCYSKVPGGIEQCFVKAIPKLKGGLMSAGKLLGAPVFGKGVCKVKVRETEMGRPFFERPTDLL